MSNNDWLKYYQVKVPNRSGADRGFIRTFTGLVGKEYPVLCKEVIPGSVVNVDVAHSVQLPPLASDTFMNVDWNYEAFFVPYRILYGGYEAWLTGGKIRNGDGDLVAPEIPLLKINFSDDDSLDYLVAGQLADFLGYRFTDADLVYLNTESKKISGGIYKYFNIYKFLGYHRVINDWYLRTNVQTQPFNHNIEHPTYLENLPFHAQDHGQEFALKTTLGNGIALGALASRNFGSDYFTEAFVSAAAGNVPQINLSGSFPVVFDGTEDMSSEGSVGFSKGSSDFGLYEVIHKGDDDYRITGHVSVQQQLTLPAIRSLNSVYQYCERNNLPSPRMQDYVKAQYGAHLSDGIAQRAMLLGSATYTVYSKAIENNSMAEGTKQSNNPFTSVGARFGNAYTTGKGSLVDHFSVNEPGLIFVMACLTPKVRYATGIDKDNLRYNRQGSQVDLPNPILQNTGYEPIMTSELNSRNIILDSVFGYTDKYADSMTSLDQINGLMRSGESLESFALQRGFGSGASLNNSFLQIPTTYMKGVEAVDNEASGFDFWCDMFIDFKASQPLQKYSVPTLQDPAYEHGHTVVMRRNGSRID